MITHLLFDFFGTLVEYSGSRTEQGYERSHAVLLANGVTLGYREFLERWADMFHKFDLMADENQDEFSMDDVVTGFLKNILGAEPPPELVNNFRDTYLQEWNTGVNYIDGVPALLNQLKDRYTLVLVTNTHNGDLIRSHLESMKVTEYFSSIITSVEHGKRKPHTSIFEDALQATGGESRNALYIGDTFTTDYVGANDAGMRCLLIDPHEKQNIPSEDRISHILDLGDRVLYR
jgi:putative hydrolase of the HAD superfamily